MTDHPSTREARPRCAKCYGKGFAGGNPYPCPDCHGSGFAPSALPGVREPAEPLTGCCTRCGTPPTIESGPVNEIVNTHVEPRCTCNAGFNIWPSVAALSTAHATAERTNDAMQEDVAELLRALGLGDHARPASPHDVVQAEILPRLRQWPISRITDKPLTQENADALYDSLTELSEANAGLRATAERLEGENKQLKERVAGLEAAIRELRDAFYDGSVDAMAFSDLLDDSVARLRD